jgi:DNA adenine methylase
MKPLHLTGYYGGKFTHLPHLLRYVPKHELYCDVFGGMMPLLLNKPKSAIECYNDINHRLVNLWRIIQSKDVEYLCDRCALSVKSRELFEEYQTIHPDPAEDAFRFLYCLNHSFSKKGTEIQGLSNIQQIVPLDNKINDIRRIHKRIRGVNIENQDFRKLIPRCDRKSAFLYADPPYYEGGDVYEKTSGNDSTWTAECMTELITILNTFTGKWMLSIDKDISTLFTCRTFVYRYQMNQSVCVRKGDDSTIKADEFLIMNYQLERNLLEYGNKSTKSLDKNN